MISQIPQAQVQRRVKTITLPKDLKSKVLQEVSGWVTHNGVVWTLGRLKEVKASVLSAKAGNFQKPSWFKVTPYGNLSGCWGQLVGLSQRSNKDFFKVVSFLNIYTSWFYKEVPRCEIETAKKNIQSPPVELPKWLQPPDVLFQRSTWTGKDQEFSLPRGKITPSFIPISVQPPGGVQLKKVVKDILDIRDSSVYCIPQIQALIQRVCGLTLEPMHFTTSQHVDVVGDVWFKGEPGLKVRYYAAPNLVLQRLMEPLKDHLLELCKSLPWDCTHDQRKADESILQRLGKGENVYSVDLSKATDHFPWKLQRRVLGHLLFKPNGNRTQAFRRLVYEDPEDPWKLITKLPLEALHNLNYTQIVYFLVRFCVEIGQWRVNGREDEVVSWTKGQPLGLAPSFPLFAITHGLLLYHLNHGRWDNDFFVLGDDVVIFKKGLYRSYMRTMSHLGVEVSAKKSFSSSRLAQFAGKTYVEKKSTWFSPWREITKENFIDLQQFWPPGLLQGEWKELADWVLSLPEPYGIGRNPFGLPLSTRLSPELVKELLMDTEKPVPSTVEPSFAKLWQDSPDWMKYSILKSSKLLPWTPDPNRIKVPTSMLSLMDGTEVSGCPFSCRKKRVDPWTLGRVGYWRKLHDRLHLAKRKDF